MLLIIYNEKFESHGSNLQNKKASIKEAFVIKYQVAGFESATPFSQSRMVELIRPNSI